MTASDPQARAEELLWAAEEIADAFEDSDPTTWGAVRVWLNLRRADALDPTHPDQADES